METSAPRSPNTSLGVTRHAADGTASAVARARTEPDRVLSTKARCRVHARDHRGADRRLAERRARPRIIHRDPIRNNVPAADSGHGIAGQSARLRRAKFAPESAVRCPRTDARRSHGAARRATWRRADHRHPPRRRSDLYSVGVMLWEAIVGARCGAHPPAVTGEKQIPRPRPAARCSGSHVPDSSRGYVRVLSRAPKIDRRCLFVGTSYARWWTSGDRPMALGGGACPPRPSRASDDHSQTSRPPPATSMAAPALVIASIPLPRTLTLRQAERAATRRPAPGSAVAAPSPLLGGILGDVARSLLLLRCYLLS